MESPVRSNNSILGRSSARLTLESEKIKQRTIFNAEVFKNISAIDYMIMSKKNIERAASTSRGEASKIDKLFKRHICKPVLIIYGEQTFAKPKRKSQFDGVLSAIRFQRSERDINKLAVEKIPFYKKKQFIGTLRTSIKPTKLDGLLDDCDRTTKRVRKDLREFIKDKKVFLRTMRRLKIGLETERNVYNKACAKEFLEKKTAFIYGKNGKGRFLNIKAEDNIHMRDIVMNMNPNYTFLSKKIDECLKIPKP